MAVSGQRHAGRCTPGKTQYPLYRRLFYTEYFDLILQYQLTNADISCTINRHYFTLVLDNLFIYISF